MAEPPTTYQVRAQCRPGGVAHVQAGDQTVPIDTAWGVEPSGAPGPAELLAAAFASCLMKNIERTSTLIGFTYTSADVRVQARRQDSPPQFVEVEYDVRIVTDEPERRVDLLHRNLRQFGTVYNTLAAVCDVHGTVAAATAEA
ncbi:MAG: OsmC family protein [Brooklawnia sp.]|uniref:OsmC family protein n=1 Tax=Brooklawnia sp. TaxID=2699740 RepID=UPI003C79589D